ncbi:MAG: RNA polymerase sigma factor [Acidimicrobiales bacterium]
MGSQPPQLPAAELRTLVLRARDNDPDAWETLYRLAYPSLCAYAQRRLSRRDDADDAVSETFIRAYDRLDDFHWMGAGVLAWLFGILRNVVRESQRADWRISPLVGDYACGMDDLVDEPFTPWQTAALRQAFATLEPSDQEILELRVMSRLSAEDVAVVVGKHPGAVRMAQSRAMARLRSALEGVTAP